MAEPADKEKVEKMQAAHKKIFDILKDFDDEERISIVLSVTQIYDLPIIYSLR